MDIELERRRLAHESPFDGVTLHTPEYLPLSELRRFLAAILPILHPSFGDMDLRRLEDWHEHDGFLSLAHPASWPTLLVLLESDQALRQGAGQSDDYVRATFFDSSHAFLLRLYIPEDFYGCHSPDNPDPIPCGVLDLSGSPSLIEDALVAVPADLIPKLRAEPARQFFDKRYAG